MNEDTEIDTLEESKGNIPSVDRDYTQVLLEDDKALENYSVNERRKYLLNKIYEVRIPDEIHQGKMADKFGVSNVQIHKDLKILRKFMKKYPEKNHEFETVSLAKHVVEKLVEEGEYKDAMDAQMKFSEWLENRGAIDKEPEKHEIIDTINTDFDVVDVDSTDVSEI